MSGSLMILVAGPYRSGTDGDRARIQANVDAMTRTAVELHRRGHLPVMGEWFALPLIEAAVAAGESHDAAYDAIFHPVAEQVLARCDGCLRIGGPSEGADRMVAIAHELGKPVWRSIDQISSHRPIRARLRVSETRSTPIRPGYRPDAWLDQEVTPEGIRVYRGVHPEFDSPIAPGEEREVLIVTRSPEDWRPLRAGEVVELFEGHTPTATLTILEDWVPSP
jgi:hypothetical protein